MSWIIVVCSVLGAWAVLRIFGGERQRQVQDFETTVLDAARVLEQARLKT